MPVAPQPYAYQNTPQAVPVDQGYQGAFGGGYQQPAGGYGQPTGGYGQPSYAPTPAASNAYGNPAAGDSKPPAPSAPVAGGYGGPARRDNKYT